MMTDGKHLSTEGSKIQKNHFIVEEFGNGWYLTKTGNFNVKLYFQPQKYYDIGLIVYASVIGSCLFYIF